MAWNHVIDRMPCTPFALFPSLFGECRVASGSGSLCLQGRLLGRRPGQSGGAAVRVWGIESRKFISNPQDIPAKSRVAQKSVSIEKKQWRRGLGLSWWSLGGGLHRTRCDLVYTRYTPSYYTSQYLEGYVKRVKGRLTTSDGSRWRCRVTDFVSMGSMGVSVKVHNLWTVAARSWETLGLKSLFERACWMNSSKQADTWLQNASKFGVN